jgi:RNA polymerase sigma-70 factor (ECF subfamily)
VNQDELVARCLAGDGEAFRQVHDEHAGRIVVYFLRSGFSAADADDLRQEVFLRAFKSLGGFDPARGSLAAWLGAIARNTVRRHWQRASADGQLDPELAEAVLREEPPDHAARQEELESLRQCINRLPAELSRLVGLRYVEGLTTRGIAARANLPEATVRLRLAEARNLLADCLKAKGVLE